jgi:hypothetical protein
MPRGRRSRIDRPVRWELSIPTSLAAEVELKLIDPLRRTQLFGSRSRLVQLLLREWLTQQQEKPQTTTTIIGNSNVK